MAIQQFKATVSDLLASIRIRGNIPQGDDSYSDDDILILADEELQTRLLPLILSTQEDYYVESMDYAGTVTSLLIPDRAIGGKLRDVVKVNANGEEIPLNRVESAASASSADHYWVRGNKVLFRSAPGETIRLYYHIRPNHLCKLNACSVITSLTANSITVNVAPSSFTSDVTYDVVPKIAPYKLVTQDLVVTSVVGSTLNVDSVPSGVAIGQYLCVAGQAPVVQVPYELIPILAQRVVCKILEASGNKPEMQAAKVELKDMEADAFKMLEPRIDSQPPKITNRFRSF